MKKLNNKGFAITTLIYGLAILGILLMTLLMSTMSQARSNNTEIVRSIEDELNNFSQTESFFMGKVDENDLPLAQEYIVPDGETGWYRIELWGTQGGESGGLGAYTSGVIRLTEGDKLYFYVGKQEVGRQGAETDVRIVSGNYNSYASYQTRIMVAAGGGIGEDADGGTLYGYTSTMKSLGGEVDAENATKSYGIISTESLEYSNGTLVGYPKNYARSTLTQTEVTGLNLPGNGGDGYYSSNDQTVGGVSFISGYAGSKAIINGAVSNQPTYDYVPFTYNEVTDEYHFEPGASPIRYAFLNGTMMPGVQKGDGKAKIERLMNTNEDTIDLPRKNTKLDQVRYIKDCLNEDKTTTFSAIIKTNNISDNPDVAYGKSITSTGNCKIVDLGAIYSLEEIAVWHDGNDGHDLLNHQIQVSKDNTNWINIKGISPNTPLSETETVTGIHISAYQNDAMSELPTKGEYYIIPVLSENKAMTAKESSETDSNAITIERINGLKTQRWAIELLSNSDPTIKEYKIIELARNKALNIMEDENLPHNRLAASSYFNSYRTSRPQIWKVTPAGNGTYYITTAQASRNAITPSGNILPQTNQKISDFTNQLIIGRNNASTERFKLIILE